jgi:uncharacterized membrane protein YdjX (TVP38/TMEM64 family)
MNGLIKTSLLKKVGISLLIPIIILILFPDIGLEIKRVIDILSTGDINKLREYLLSFGVLAPLASFILMVFQSVIAPLPAFVITFTNGLIFGVFWGAVLSWSSAMVGAIICFYISRVFGRPFVERIVGNESLKLADNFFRNYGKYAILIARLLPFISFDLISYAAGLTSIDFLGYLIATGIGQLPGTIVYSYLGHNVTGSVKILFFIFILILILLTLKIAYLNRLKKRESAVNIV